MLPLILMNNFKAGFFFCKPGKIIDIELVQQDVKMEKMELLTNWMRP
jgi:hypothetical protein